jgi:FPC/CPF motif-containing protein YcgG
LATYAASAQDVGPFTALLAIFPPDDPVLSLDRYSERFWTVLGELRARDPAPWPADIPTDPSHQLWEFCFNGEAMFVLCSNPGHRSRKTRYSDNFVISFQPRFMFDRLIAQRHLLARARKLIRSRVLAFDGFAVHPQIGMYFESTNLEWRQYFVPDDNALMTEECPFATPNYQPVLIA